MTGNDTSPQAKRLFERVDASLRVEIEWEETHDEGRLTDLSPTGAFIVGARQLPGGATCGLRVHGDDAGIEEVFVALAHVVRSTPEGMGVEFVEMPVESVGVLQRLWLAMQQGAS